MQEKITVEKVKDLIYDLQNEFEDMIGYDWEFMGKELTEDHFDFASYTVNCFANKLKLLIADKLCDKEK